MNQTDDDLFFLIRFLQLLLFGDILEKQNPGVFLARDFIRPVVDLNLDVFHIPLNQIVDLRQPHRQFFGNAVDAALSEQFAHPGDRVVFVISQNPDLAKLESILGFAAQNPGNAEHPVLAVLLKILHKKIHRQRIDDEVQSGELDIQIEQEVQAD